MDRECHSSDPIPILVESSALTAEGWGKSLENEERLNNGPRRLQSEPA
jgi:hypothetical protein